MDDLKIVAEYETFVVVEKPSGMLSIPGRGADKLDSVATRVRERYPDAIAQPTVHRLDMETSGLLVVALTKESHRNLSMQFQNRQVIKYYEALIEGEILAEEGRIELPFRLDIDNRPHQIYDEVYGKMGLTWWKRLGLENGRTRVEFIPLTGRTHQLRLHSSHEKGFGSPIEGDTLYGNGTTFFELKLHAKLLRFRSPESGELLNFESVVPF